MRVRREQLDAGEVAAASRPVEGRGPVPVQAPGAEDLPAAPKQLPQRLEPAVARRHQARVVEARAGAAWVVGAQLRVDVGRAPHLEGIFPRS